MAISKKRKEELVDMYVDWLKRSQAIILTDYRGQPTKSVYQLRTKARTTEGELHVVKNTLIARALREVGMAVPDKLLAGPTAAVFCFGEPPAVAKTVIQFAGENKTFTIKGAVMSKSVLDAAGVRALSELPPRPVVLAQVLGTIQAPASKVAGVLGAGLRQVVSVIQARVDQLKAAEGVAA